MGKSEDEGLAFERVVKTAQALGAPTIRVWPGSTASALTSPEHRARILQELHRIADLAQSADLTVSMEFHSHTLTDELESTRRLLGEIIHPALRFYWQPWNGVTTQLCLESLRLVLPRLSHLHVFHWWPSPEQRLPLQEGVERWRPFLETVAEGAPAERRFAMLEFVPGDSLESYFRDAATLLRWLDGRFE